MVINIYKFEENKLFSHAVKEIENKLTSDKKVDISNEDILNLSQEIVLTSQNNYFEIADIIKDYIETTTKKRYGLAQSIKRILDEYSTNS